MKISAKELMAAIEKGRSHLVDVRTPAEYGAEHISGARLRPLQELKPEELKSELRGEECVLICRSGKRASMAFQKLKEGGCENLKILEGGMMAWEEAGYPVERGAAVLPLDQQMRIVAGSLVVLGVVLGLVWNPWWALLSAGVGLGQIFSGMTGICPLSRLLERAPWNSRGRRESDSSRCCVGH